MIERIEEVLNRLDQFVDTSESVVVGLVAKIAPWATPIPTAYLVYNRTMVHLSWPPWIAAIAAITIETMGLATTSTWLRLYRYNKTRKKVPADFQHTDPKTGRSRRYRGRVDPEAPIILPGLLTLLYIITAEFLTVTLDIAAKQSNLTITDLAPAMFPFLSLAGMALLAIQADHTQRLQEIIESRKPRSKTTPRPKLSTWATKYQCWCGWVPKNEETAAQSKGGHSKSHYREVQNGTPSEALSRLKELYPAAPEYPKIREIAEMQAAWRQGKTPAIPEGRKS